MDELDRPTYDIPWLDVPEFRASSGRNSMHRAGGSAGGAGGVGGEGGNGVCIGPRSHSSPLADLSIPNGLLTLLLRWRESIRHIHGVDNYEISTASPSPSPPTLTLKPNQSNSTTEIQGSQFGADPLRVLGLPWFDCPEYRDVRAKLVEVQERAACAGEEEEDYDLRQLKEAVQQQRQAAFITPYSNHSNHSNHSHHSNHHHGGPVSLSPKSATARFFTSSPPPSSGEKKDRRTYSLIMSKDTLRRRKPREKSIPSHKSSSRERSPALSKRLPSKKSSQKGSKKGKEKAKEKEKDKDKERERDLDKDDWSSPGKRRRSLEPHSLFGRMPFRAPHRPSGITGLSGPGPPRARSTSHSPTSSVDRSAFRLALSDDVFRRSGSMDSVELRSTSILKFQSPRDSHHQADSRRRADAYSRYQPPQTTTENSAFRSVGTTQTQSGPGSGPGSGPAGAGSGTTSVLGLPHRAIHRQSSGNLSLRSQTPSQNRQHGGATVHPITTAPGPRTALNQTDDPPPPISPTHSSSSSRSARLRSDPTTMLNSQPSQPPKTETNHTGSDNNSNRDRNAPVVRQSSLPKLRLAENRPRPRPPRKPSLRTPISDLWRRLKEH